ncbi:hypothetical protein [Paenibacillus wynnii]|uniref:Intracellular proteinase inhibitor BsuPI domain-containing protein n=1 Tax=Paenibacillus wynnii TaxID=268407 RepID=A0A098M532_9BACL|nr:hypothetical protein [Paenibacillus wynnii]KGE17655.1 hypothetical protein PWYN_24075 [Paenibacillus wynnii]
MNYILIFILGISLVLSACSNTNSDNESESVSTGLQGNVDIKVEGTETIVFYTFKNKSKETITVIGGARYKLLKDNNLIEKGGVPIKDYLNLEPEEEYKDKKIFNNLQSGSYLIIVEWNETVVTYDFTLN